MSLPNPDAIVERLVAFQASVRDAIVAAHGKAGLHEVAHDAEADTIYAIDAEVEPLLVAFCDEWSRELPMVLIAEGVVDEQGREGPRVFPSGAREEDAAIRLIVDPIDGTRGIMYDKRPAWSLAGVAPNRGPTTRLRDIEVAVMTELPTSKQGRADVLWAIKGRAAEARRVNLSDGTSTPFAPRASTSPRIEHGFASVVNFFPGVKVAASELMEKIVAKLVGPADVTRPTVFDDQYISTGGQFYELIVGHDRFVADVRPLLYAREGKPEGLCSHPYDCATWLIAEAAGVVLTDGRGGPLDGPMDTTTGLPWAAYANRKLHDSIQPILTEFLR